MSRVMIRIGDNLCHIINSEKDMPLRSKHQPVQLPICPSMGLKSIKDLCAEKCIHNSSKHKKFHTSTHFSGAPRYCKAYSKGVVSRGCVQIVVRNKTSKAIRFNAIYDN
jgi:hypothetical protein